MKLSKVYPPLLLFDVVIFPALTVDVAIAGHKNIAYLMCGSCSMLGAILWSEWRRAARQLEKQ